MKKKGSKSDFNSERNAELRAAFFNQGVYSTSEAVINRTIKSPASRFWVDPDRARDMMSRMEKDPGVVKGMHPARQRMYCALYEKYKAIRKAFPADPKIKAVSMAIYSGAPEFYVAVSTARAIIGERSSQGLRVKGYGREAWG